MLRKLPAITTESKDFWQGGAEGELRIYHCNDCARYFHPPSPVCPNCVSDNVAAKTVSGKATIASFTINHQQWQPELETPFVVGMVEIVEQRGLRLVTNIINCDPQEVQIGLAAKVQFLQQEDVWLPMFELDTPDAIK